MALSCFLRNSLNAVKSNSSYLRLATQVSPLSTFASERLLTKSTSSAIEIQNKFKVPVQGFGLTNAVRQFTTTPVKMSAMGADHGKLWTIERYLSAALIPVAPLAIMYPNILFDLILAVTTTMHVHWGVEAVVVDYVRPIIFGNLIPKISVMLIYVYSVLLLVGLLNLTFRGKGIGNSIKQFWTI